MICLQVSVSGFFPSCCRRFAARITHLQVAGHTCTVGNDISFISSHLMSSINIAFSKSHSDHLNSKYFIHTLLQSSIYSNQSTNQSYKVITIHGRLHPHLHLPASPSFLKPTLRCLARLLPQNPRRALVHRRPDGIFHPANAPHARPDRQLSPVVRPARLCRFTWRHKLHELPRQCRWRTAGGAAVCAAAAAV